MKVLYKYILVISLVFLVIYLYKFNYIDLVPLKSVRLFLLSVLMLLIGMFFYITRWWKMLQVAKLPVSLKDASISISLTILSKYVPGKLWMIVGKASYINKKYDYDSGGLIGLSFLSQVLAIFSGTFLFGIRALYEEGYRFIGIGLMIISFLGCFAIFFPKLWAGINNLLNGLFKKKKIELVQMNWLQGLKVIPHFFGYWIFISFGFYFLGRSMGIDDFTLSDGFIYPGCVIIGVLALFAPGGLGIREGALVAILTYLNYSSSEAVSLSVWSRLWFLIGELALFLSVLVLDYKGIVKIFKRRLTVEDKS